MAITVLMADTIHQSAENIPAEIQKVAGYETGSRQIKWESEDWARFNPENTGFVHINQDPSSDVLTGNVFDVEEGAWTPEAAAKAAKTRHEQGRETCLYGSADSMPAIVAALDAEGLQDTGHCSLWVAAWSLDSVQAADEVGTVYRGYPVVAVQWASPSSNPETQLPGSGQTLKAANVDLSQALASWFAPVAPAPEPEPEPEPAPVPPVTPAPVAVTGLLVTAHSGALIATQVTSTDDGKTWS